MCNRDKIVHMDFASMAITAAIAGGAAFLGSYLKKKGENLATKEDIEDLRKQTATLTQTTEESRPEYQSICGQDSNVGTFKNRRFSIL